MPVLYQNIMFGLPSDFAREVFLWAVERPGEHPMCYRAESFAREADYLLRAVGHLIELASYARLKAAAAGVTARILSEDQKGDLLAFILQRHANYRHGGNLAAPYAQGVPL